MFHLPWTRTEPRPAPSADWCGTEEVVREASRVHALLTRLSQACASVTMLEAAENHLIRTTLHPVDDPESGLPISRTTLDASAMNDQRFNVIAKLDGIELMFSSRLRLQPAGGLSLACPTEILYMDLRHDYRIAGHPGDRVILTQAGGQQSFPVPLHDLSEGGICLRLSLLDRDFARRFAEPSNGLLRCEQISITLGQLRQCHLDPQGQILRAGYRFESLHPAAQRQLRILLLQRQALKVNPRA